MVIVDKRVVLILIMALVSSADIRPAVAEALNGSAATAGERIALTSAGGGDTHSADSQASGEDINPHWDKSRCGVCHQSLGNKVPELRYKDERQLCIRCHENDIVHKYIHPDGLKLTKSINKQIKESWKKGIRLDGQGKLTCMTCHDLTIQCLKVDSYTKRLNTKFLREGPYSKRYDICYKCHNEQKYQRMNSHEQIAKDGTVKVKKCKLCHKIQAGSRIKTGMKREPGKFPILESLNHDRLLLCIRCHKKIDHPSGAFTVKSMNEYRHFITITNDKKRTLEKTTMETGVVLPLEPDTDRVYCATCHEPHQPGLFAGDDVELFKQTQKRLRAPDICTRCHDK